MKFSVENKTRENSPTLLRRIGYRFLGIDQKTGQMSFTRPLEQNPYPRFHLYSKEQEKTDKLYFTLHLDQKKPSYKGVPAHSAEYEGEFLEKEKERIKEFFNPKAT